MNIIKEALNNLEQIEAQSVTNPVMANAVKDSKDKATHAKEVSKTQDKPFTSGDKQPQPKEVEFPKMTLEESLFESVDSSKRVVQIDMDMEIPEGMDGVEIADQFFRTFEDDNIDCLGAQFIDDVTEQYPSEYKKSGHRIIGISADFEIPEEMNGNDVAEMLKDQYLTDDVFCIGSQFADDLTDTYDTLYEADGRQNSALKDLDDTDDPNEENDIWTRVYAELVRNSADAAWHASQHKRVPSKTSERYDHVDPVNDSDLKVYADNDAIMEEDGILLVNPDGKLAHAQKVADAYGLTYKVGKVNSIQAKPDETTYMIIHIPDPEQIVDESLSSNIFEEFDCESSDFDEEELEQEVMDDIDEGILDTVKDKISTAKDKIANFDDALTAVNNANADQKLGDKAQKFVNGVNKVGNGILNGLDAVGTVNDNFNGHARIRGGSLHGTNFSNKKNDISTMIKDMSKDDIIELKKALAEIK